MNEFGGMSWRARGTLGPQSCTSLEGPWVIENADGKRIALLSAWGSDEQKSMARLMAAAPDLLEACKVASALLKCLPKSLGYEFDARQFDAAIAKALGKDQEVSK